MNCGPLYLDRLTGSAFLDRNGQYAKREDDLRTVRLFYASADSPVPTVDLTPEQFAALSEEDQQRIRDAGVSVKVNL